MCAIQSQIFGTVGERPCREYSLSNGQLEVSILELGGIIRTLKAPDRNGRWVDVVLGYDTLEEYLRDEYYLGAIVGPVAGRLSRGSGSPPLLHSGPAGFSHQLFSAISPSPPSLPHISSSVAPTSNLPNAPNPAAGCPAPFSDNVAHHRDNVSSTNPPCDGSTWCRSLSTAFSDVPSATALTLHYHRPDGEGGFPGTLDFYVTYTLYGSALQLDYNARCNADTLWNPTSHSYFDLSGCGQLSEQLLALASDHIAPMDEKALITPGSLPIAGTPFDFSVPKTIGKQLSQSHPELKFGGLDTCYLFSPELGAEEKKATLFSPTSGIQLDLFTDCPCVLVYTANGLQITGKGGKHFGPHSAICLETEAKMAPPARLSAGAPYHSFTRYHFSKKG